MNHNFQYFEDKSGQYKYRVKKGMVLWRCLNCDSIVMFSLKYTEHDVNKIMTMRLKCLPPIQSIN